jgi:hypothetical protein
VQIIIFEDKKILAQLCEIIFIYSLAMHGTTFLENNGIPFVKEISKP